MKNLHDNTLLGRYLFWYWDDESVIKYLFKIYISGTIGAILVFGSSLPLMLVNNLYWNDNPILYWIGGIMTVIQLFSAIVQPKIIYDLIEVVGSIVYYLLMCLFTFIFFYIGYNFYINSK